MNLVRGVLLFFLIISSIIAIPFQYSEGGSNSAPDLLPIGDQREDENDTSELYFTATDPDPDDILTFTSSPLPLFAVLIDNGDRTARLVMATSCSDTGSYQITITVTDNGTPNLSDSETFDLVITEDCDPIPPEILADKVIMSDVNDNVVVSYGEIVVITNSATVNGDIQVNGGTVIITESSTIKGNIESNGGSILIKQGSVVEGNVDILVSGDGGVLEINTVSVYGNVVTNGIGTLTITNSDFNGNIYSENDSDVTITGNTVNGNIEILGPQSCSESSNNVNGNNSGCP